MLLLMCLGVPEALNLEARGFLSQVCQAGYPKSNRTLDYGGSFCFGGGRSIWGSGLIALRDSVPRPRMQITHSLSAYSRDGRYQPLTSSLKTKP